ncbi:hypothetical protein [Kitasatospora sp. NPDC050543]
MCQRSGDLQHDRPYLLAVAEGGTQYPILHDTPEQAAHTVIKAYLARV